MQVLQVFTFLKPKRASTVGAQSSTGIGFYRSLRGSVSFTLKINTVFLSDEACSESHTVTHTVYVQMMIHTNFISEASPPFSQ